MFKERGSNSATAEPEEDIKTAMERLRKENEEKIRKIKEELEQNEKDFKNSFGFGGKEEKGEENKKDQKTEQQEKETKKEEKKEKSWSEKYEEEKREKEGKKEEDLGEKRKKYSQEFQRKPLNVEKNKSKGYTLEMRNEDLSHLDSWMQYEFGRFEWMMGELGIETKRKIETAANSDELKRISDWHYEQVKQVHKYLDDKKKEIWELKDRVMKAFLYREDPNDKKEKEAEQKFGLLMRDFLGKLSNFDFKNFKDPNWKKKADEYQNEILILYKTGSWRGVICESWKERLEVLQKLGVGVEDFLRKAEEAKIKARKPGSSGGQGGPEKPDPEKPGGGKPENQKEKAENIAIQELGITRQEFEVITGNIATLGDTDITRLTLRVLGISNNDKTEVKKAYYKCAKEWHPDGRKTRYGIGVNEVKFKIANNLYGEYNKRFGK